MPKLEQGRGRKVQREKDGGGRTMAVKQRAHVMSVLWKSVLGMHKLGVVEKKKVDQQAGFAAGTYCCYCEILPLPVLALGTWC